MDSGRCVVRGQRGYCCDPSCGHVWNRSSAHIHAFSAQHKIVGRVDGRFDKARGTVVVSSDLSKCGVDVTIDAESLSTQNSIRDEDMRGPDFFAATKYPTVEYHGRGVRQSGES
jgi:polyisoprenoid-binding protein YceI